MIIVSEYHSAFVVVSPVLSYSHSLLLCSSFVSGCWQAIGSSWTVIYLEILRISQFHNLKIKIYIFCKPLVSFIQDIFWCNIHFAIQWGIDSQTLIYLTVIKVLSNSYCIVNKLSNILVLYITVDQSISHNVSKHLASSSAVVMFGLQVQCSSLDTVLFTLWNVKQQCCLQSLNEPTSNLFKQIFPNKYFVEP